MNVLLLRLVGPLQSWGVQSRFSVRDTGLEPSKSGVIGLLCAALGRPRHADVEDLAALRMGVRVDQEGRLRYDFHTAQHVLKAGGGIKDTEPSRRYYLADAKFLVGLAGESSELLTRLLQALAAPIWPLYLGRKAFVPGEPIWLEDGLRLGSGLENALREYPSLVSTAESARRLVLESDEGREVRPDQPISFARREFALRRVRTTFLAPLPLVEQADPKGGH
jgi:CRISPR system Cascade subunit CasD